MVLLRACLLAVGPRLPPSLPFLSTPAEPYHFPLTFSTVSVNVLVVRQSQLPTSSWRALLVVRWAV